MENYRLTKPTMTPEGNVVLVALGVVTLTDDARGADRYVELKRQGYTLERLPSCEADAE